MSPSSASFGILRSELELEVAQYLGLKPGGVNLRQALVDLPRKPIEHLVTALRTLKATGGRLLFMGNGGSHDNARALAFLFRSGAIESKTVGCEDDYARVTLERGYGEIFVHALTADRITPQDVVVGISGSGNSPNVVAALEYAKGQGAQVFCLGGRDGGKMRPVCGEDNSIIVKNACMEAIEDLHMFVGVLAFRQLSANRLLSETHKQLLLDFDAVISDRNLGVYTDAANGVLRTIESGSRVLALGTSIGSNHVTADWERGATNRLPIRGVSAPMMFSLNAAMATLNDDGHYSVAHGLVKKSPTPDDFGIIFDVLAPARETEAVREILESSGTPFVCIGGKRGVSLAGFENAEQDIFPALVGHLVSASVREVLGKKFDVKARPDLSVDFFPGDRKLGRRATLELEATLRSTGVLAEGRVLVFNYGQVFEAADPKKFGLQREFY